MYKKLNILESRLPNAVQAANLRIGIVKTAWNTEIVEALYQDCVKQLVTQGVLAKNISVRVVPGAFELAHGTQQLLAQQKCEVIICLGALLQGATYHFEVLANSVTHALQMLSISCGVPVIFGVLTCNHEQAVERVYDGIAKGWADSALMMTHQENMQVPSLETMHQPQL
ncbi:MAG: 6,7-dimethyl-8-ribityllumazine synthase [Candidatus Babeliales bacterium]